MRRVGTVLQALPGAPVCTRNSPVLPASQLHGSRTHNNTLTRNKTMTRNNTLTRNITPDLLLLRCPETYESQLYPHWEEEEAAIQPSRHPSPHPPVVISRAFFSFFPSNHFINK